MKRLLYVVLLAIWIASPARADEAAVIETAKSETLSWLALTDTAQYESSWEKAATFFKDAIAEDDWVRSVSSARKPFGPLKSRAMTTANFSTTLPGAPDGEYVVFEFGSSFENKAAAVETVTAMKDTDGAWRVAGYFIR